MNLETELRAALRERADTVKADPALAAHIRTKVQGLPSHSLNASTMRHSSPAWRRSSLLVAAATVLTVGAVSVLVQNSRAHTPTGISTAQHPSAAPSSSTPSSHTVVLASVGDYDLTWLPSGFTPAGPAKTLLIPPGTDKAADTYIALYLTVGGRAFDPNTESLDSPPAITVQVIGMRIPDSNRREQLKSEQQPVRVSGENVKPGTINGLPAFFSHFRTQVDIAFTPDPRSGLDIRIIANKVDQATLVRTAEGFRLRKAG